MVARIFTNLIFSATLGKMSKLYCARLHEYSLILFVKIRATDQVAIKTQDTIFVKIRAIRGQ